MEEADRKRTLYVGGLAEKVDIATLTAAFLPFGEIKDVQIPLDHGTQQSRGFGFVQFEELEDAMAAVDNMHCTGMCLVHATSVLRAFSDQWPPFCFVILDAFFDGRLASNCMFVTCTNPAQNTSLCLCSIPELFGKVLSVNIARPQKIKLGYSRPVWAEADDWYKTKLKADGMGASADAADAAKTLVKATSDSSSDKN